MSKPMSPIVALTKLRNLTWEFMARQRFLCAGEDGYWAQVRIGKASFRRRQHMHRLLCIIERRCAGRPADIQAALALVRSTTEEVIRHCNNGFDKYERWPGEDALYQQKEYIDELKLLLRRRAP